MIYTSPDGGHTVYTEIDGKRVLVSEDDYSRRRRRLAYLQQAIGLADRDPYMLELVNNALEPVLMLAKLRGHTINEYTDNLPIK